MKLTLAHEANPDIDGGYWETPTDPDILVIDVQSLQDARKEFLDWRDTNGLGGGNMSADHGCGTVTDNGKAIGHFSYNGRFWEMGNYPTPEIIID